MESIRNKPLSKSRADNIGRKLARLEKATEEYWRLWSAACLDWGDLNEELDRFPEIQGDLRDRYIKMYKEFGESESGTPEYLLGEVRE